MENTKPREKLLTTTAAINTARSTTITKRNVITSTSKCKYIHWEYTYHKYTHYK